MATATLPGGVTITIPEGTTCAPPPLVATHVLLIMAGQPENLPGVYGPPVMIVSAHKVAEKLRSYYGDDAVIPHLWLSAPQVGQVRPIVRDKAAQSYGSYPHDTRPEDVLAWMVGVSWG